MKAILLQVLSGLLASGFVLWAISGCSTVPVTGRKQLSLVSSSQETELGLASFQQMKLEVPTSRDASAQALVEKVGRRIAAVASKDLPNAKWEFVVFDSKEMNAFCLPGGKVGVYAGILAITRDEAGLATVLGHEVAHAAAHHGGERMSEAMVMQGGQEILGTTLSSSDPQKQAAAKVAYGLIAQYGRELPHSRKQESEADEIGLIYMARAGYDPRRALDFWQRFSQATASSDTTPSFFRTHPVTADRIKHIQELLPQAQAEFKRSAVPAGR